MYFVLSAFFFFIIIEIIFLYKTVFLKVPSLPLLLVQLA